MLVIALAMAILAPIFAKLLELAVSRQREYMADASAVQLTRNPDGLARALDKLSRPKKKLEVANHAMEHMYIVNPFKPLQAANSLFSTHPPLKARVQRLQTMGARLGNDDEYNPYAPLPDVQEKPPLGN
jgi:heat shock protein HtpX